MAWHTTWNEPPRRPRRSFFTDRGGFLPPGVKLVLFACIAVFFLEIFYAGPLMRWGALSVRGLMHFQAWRLVSYMFLHGSADHIIINMFVFVMLGVAFERQIGTRQFLWLYFAAGVIGGLFEVAFNLLMYWRYGSAALNTTGETFLTLPAVGASAGVAGILIAFAVLNPRAEFLLFFLIPIQARWIALFYVLIETRHVVLGLTHGWTDNVAHAAHFGGMAVGFVWIKFGPLIASGLSRLAGESRVRNEVRPGWRRSDDEAEVDRILRKIHEEGIDSLTPGERMLLQDASRRRGR